VRYCIYKRIRSKNRLDRMRRFLTGDEEPSQAATYFGDPARIYFQRMATRVKGGEEGAGIEPLALLHRSFDSQEVW